MGASDIMIVYNNQQLTRLCSFQEDFVVLQSPLRNNGNQGQQAIIPLKHQRVPYQQDQEVTCKE